MHLAHVPVMTDQQIIHYGELLQTARAQLDQARAKLPDGGSSFDTTLDMVEALLARVIALETASAPNVPMPATPNTKDTPHDTR